MTLSSSKRTLTSSGELHQVHQLGSQRSQQEALSWLGVLQRAENAAFRCADYGAAQSFTMHKVAAHRCAMALLACLLLTAAPSVSSARRLLADSDSNGVLPADTDAYATALSAIKQAGYTPQGSGRALDLAALAPAAALSAAHPAEAAPAALSEERTTPLRAATPVAAPAAATAAAPYPNPDAFAVSTAAAAPAPAGMTAQEAVVLAQLRTQDPVAADFQAQVYKARAAQAAQPVTPQSVLAALRPIHDQIQAIALGEARNPNPFQQEREQLDLIKSALPAAALVQSAAQPLTSAVQQATSGATAQATKQLTQQQAQPAGAASQAAGATARAAPAAANPFWPFG
ncbi:hypothetical protein WJX81_001218 [Elliptochloris bilobata]|uniref:Uncharacterized protein n=1 Tax=Elliptochloris bilobata TaxID=381761 RepID=A0AAW1R3D6_9CHLO